jgi:hypothetical protein
MNIKDHGQNVLAVFSASIDSNLADILIADSWKLSFTLLLDTKKQSYCTRKIGFKNYLRIKLWIEFDTVPEYKPHVVHKFVGIRVKTLRFDSLIWKKTKLAFRVDCVKIHRVKNKRIITYFRFLC